MLWHGGKVMHAAGRLLEDEPPVTDWEVFKDMMKA